MNEPLTRRATVGLAFATVGCLLVGCYALALTASGYRLLPDDVAANEFPLALKVHVTAAGASLVLVPWQLWPAIRRRRPAVHHWTGRTYAALAVVGGVSAVGAALFTSSGILADAGFAVLGVLWLATTVLAVRAAMRGDLSTHRRWAVRSFSLAFAAVTLRIYLPLAFAVGLAFETAYPVIAWLCWVPNLLLAERFLRRTRPLADRPAPAVAG